MPSDSDIHANAEYRPRLSAYLITKDEEHNLERALESLKWADEIVVLDSGSADKTIEIAKKYGAKTVVQKFNNFIDQKNRAIDLCSGDWLLNIDADEEVSPELRQSVNVIVCGSYKNSLSVYDVCRKTYYLGRWMKHCGWYPEYRSRLSKKGKARWTGDFLHETLESDGRSGRLDGDLLHRPYRDLGEHIRKIEQYTSLFAEREMLKGSKVGISDLLFRPFIRFFKMYILKAGFRDGIPGIIACVMGGWYVCMKYARLYEISRTRL